MNFNLALLKNYGALYIDLEKTKSISVEKINIYFKQVFYSENIDEVYEIYNTQVIDVIFLLINKVNDEIIELLESMRHSNKNFPIIPIVGVIDKSLLNYSLHFNINKYLLKPLKIQELCNTALVEIQKYHRKMKMKHSLKILSDEIIKLKDNNYHLNEENRFNQELINFNQYFHTSYLNQIKVSDKGKILSVSEQACIQYSLKDMIGLSLNEVFKNSNSIQKQMLHSLKNRTISETIIELKANMDKEIKLIIVPMFNQFNELKYYEFYMQ